MKRGIAVAYERHLFPRVQRAVAKRAVIYAVPEKILFLFYAEMTVFHPRRYHHRERSIAAVVGGHGENIPLFRYRAYSFELEIGSEISNLRKQVFRKLGARDLLDRREILHLGRKSYLPAEGLLLQNEYPLAAAKRIQRRRHSRGARSDNYYVIVAFDHLLPHSKARFRAGFSPLFSAYAELIIDVPRYTS